MSMKLIYELNCFKEQISKDINNSHDLIKLIIEDYSLDIKRKYMKVDFHYLLTHNIKEFDQLAILQNCLKVIRKYATNLLKKIPERPDNWRSISFRNSIFEERVNPIIGSIKILNNLGYTDTIPDCLNYPISSLPNIPNVQMILVDLLGIDMELHYLIKRQHPYPSLFESYFQCPQMNYFKATGKNIDSKNNSLEISSDKNPFFNEVLDSNILNEQKPNIININTAEKLKPWACLHCTFINISPKCMYTNTYTCSMCFRTTAIPNNQSTASSEVNYKISVGQKNEKFTFHESDHKEVYEIDNKNDVDRIKEIFFSCVNDSNIKNIVPVSPNYQLLFQLSNNEIPEERRIRMLLAEGKMSSWLKAKFALQIISQLEDDEIHNRKVVSLRDVIDLAENINPNTLGAVRLLQQECIICKETYPSRMIENLSCTCKLCKNCVRTYYEDKILNNSVLQLSCPQCLQPPINPQVLQDQRTLDHFYMLQFILKSIINENLYKKLEEMINHFSIQGELIYCPWGCGNGFIADDIVGNYLICTKCKNQICKSCNKQWKDEHSCLNNQLDNCCPNCKIVYVLEKGGCLHLICPNCNYNFCTFCKEAFYNIPNKGLHCNHPRDCHFYLRDESIESLEILLKRHKISFEVKLDYYASKCILQEAKDQGWEICNEKTVSPNNWMCEKHYKEYLVALINENAIDPVSIYPTYILENMCKKAHIAIPTPTLLNYRELLEATVKNEIPLKNKVYIPRFPTLSSILRLQQGIFTHQSRGLAQAITIKNELFVPDNELIPRGFIQQVR